MAVQILNDMPDVAVHRGEPLAPMLALVPRRPSHSGLARISGRAWFAACTAAIHLLAIAAFLTAQQMKTAISEPEPMIVSLTDTPATAERSPEFAPPTVDLAFILPEPQDVAYETESIAPPPVAAAAAITDPAPSATIAPVVESVEYVRPPAPVYPAESSRRRERGTVLLRVLVDESGKPAQVQLERSSGYSRLDDAARAAVRKALFRPYEVNGVAQPAQVLIPIEFTRRS